MDTSGDTAVATTHKEKLISEEGGQSQSPYSNNEDEKMNGNIPPEPIETGTPPIKTDAEPSNNGDKSVEEPVEKKVILMDTAKSEDEKLLANAGDEKKNEDWQVIDEKEVKEAREAVKAEKSAEPKATAEKTKETEKADEEKGEEEKPAPKKKALPKWMVEDANAPPSPSEETPAEETTEAEAGEGTLTTPGRCRGGGRGRGRGRGRGAVATFAAGGSRASRSAVYATPTKESNEDAAAELSEGRPRRSTRRTVDYAHPDATTVVAEIDDEEPGGLEILKRVSRSGRGRGAPRGRRPAKKPVKGDSDKEEDGDGDDDDGSDYGGKKGRRASSSGRGRSRGRARGRGRAAKTVANTQGKRASKRGRKDESDEDEGEVVYDDRESDKEPTPMEDDEPKPAAKLSLAKSPAKKRGRPAGSSPKKGAAAKSTPEIPVFEAEEMEADDDGDE